MNLYKVEAYALTRYVVAPDLDTALGRWNIYIKDTYAAGVQKTTSVELIASDVIMQDGPLP